MNKLFNRMVSDFGILKLFLQSRERRFGAAGHSPQVIVCSLPFGPEDNTAAQTESGYDSQYGGRHSAVVAHFCAFTP